MQLFSFPYVLLAPPTLIFLLIKYLRRSTHNKDSHYAVSSSHCHLFSHRPRYFPQHPIFKQPAYLPPSMWEAEFHTHMKDMAKSMFCIF
jgi:hypothetical protein